MASYSSSPNKLNFYAVSLFLASDLYQNSLVSVPGNNARSILEKNLFKINVYKLLIFYYKAHQDLKEQRHQPIIKNKIYFTISIFHSYQAPLYNKTSKFYLFLNLSIASNIATKHTLCVP